MINHILIELFCTRNHHNNLSLKTQCSCNQKDFSPRYECLINKCPFLDFTSHENALCFINEDSEAEEIITLGGEMLSSESNCFNKEQLLWKQICFQKIEEAYHTYMELVKTRNQSEDTVDG